jgi:hypothetical protein
LRGELRQARIERWRWDIPEITLAWYGEDAAIWRSIATLLTTVSEGHIEVNAWRDMPQAGGWIRKWGHAIVHSGSVVAESSYEAAYQEVAGWDEARLMEEHALSQDAVALIGTQKTQHGIP